LILAGGGPGTGLDHLAGLTEYERSGRIDHPTTDRVTALVVELGNPHRRYPVIHVTETNGSGSTAAMTAALLSAAGLVVGAYTNPHLVDVAERVLVDGSSVGILDVAVIEVGMLGRGDATNVVDGTVAVV
jgi:dihydrofolate synthase/folylpolyglutamate synthase